MGSKKLAVIILVFSIVAFIALTLQHYGSSNGFVEYPLPLKETHKLMDIGIVDANGDNLLDIYTSNHNFRQALLIADGQGMYRDVLDEWGLNQSQEFPGVELSYFEPGVDKAGLYIYWLSSCGND